MASKVVCSVFRKGLFDGKAAIVTGGGTGIGKAITEELLFLGTASLMTIFNFYAHIVMQYFLCIQAEQVSAKVVVLIICYVEHFTQI